MENIIDIKITKLTKKPEGKLVICEIYGIDFTVIQSEPKVYIFETNDKQIILNNIGGNIRFEYDGIKYTLESILLHDNKIDNNLILECKYWIQEWIEK